MYELCEANFNIHYSLLWTQNYRKNKNIHNLLCRIRIIAFRIFVSRFSLKKKINKHVSQICVDDLKPIKLINDC